MTASGWRAFTMSVAIDFGKNRLSPGGCLSNSVRSKKGLLGRDSGGKIGRLTRMSTAALTSVDVPPAAAAAEAEDLRPVSRPKKGVFKLVREVLDHGGPGYLQFAITNICNSKCDFCGFAVDRFDPKKRRSVTLKEARDVIDISVKNHIGYLLFVGGEPLVHKELLAMVRYAAESG